MRYTEGMQREHVIHCGQENSQMLANLNPIAPQQ